MQAFLTEIFLLFILAIGVCLVCAKFKLSSTVGFLITGIVCGPSVLGVVSDKQMIDSIADFGVALLMFTIGMELSGDALSRLKKPVFLGGTLQIGLTVVATMFLTHFTDGLPYNQGIFWGCLVALSSSAIVLRILQEKGETSKPSGRLSLAILIFQDMMVAPMLIGVPLLAGQLELSFSNMVFAIGRIVLILGGVLLFANLLLPKLMNIVVKTRMSEVLLLTTLGICMGLAVLTEKLGMSLSLGAFLAGLLMARSEYSMSAISGVLPYKEVLMSIFFISVGMLLDVNYLFAHIYNVLFTTFLFVLIKAILTMPAVLIQGYPIRTAVITSLSLAQVGEFAFVLAQSGFDANLINNAAYQSFLSMSILTMILTPFFIGIAPKCANAAQNMVSSFGFSQSEQDDNVQQTQLKNHLIIIGFGICGQHLARVSRKSGIPYLILEMNPETVTRYKDKEPISHGDASQPVILEHLGIKTANVLAIVISDPAAVRAITAEAKKLNPNLHIIARTRFFAEIGPLQNLGASEIVAEEFESSMEVFSHVLRKYMVPQQKINEFTSYIRSEQYKQFVSLALKQNTIQNFVSLGADVSVHSVLVEASSLIAGKTLKESNLRSEWGVTVVGIKRGKTKISSPSADIQMQPGDLVYIFGENDKLQTAVNAFTAQHTAYTN